MQKRIDSSKTSPECVPFLKSVWKHLAYNEVNAESAFFWDMDKIFSASFCQEGDLLSQWRGYGGQSGISIGFSYNEMRSATILPKSKDEYRLLDSSIYSLSDPDRLSYPPSEVNWVQIAYQPKEKERLCSQLINNIISAFEQKTLEDKHTYLTADLLRQMFPAMKNPGFQEEKECRMFAYYFSNEKVDVSYRIANGLLIPYVNFRILDYQAHPFPTVLPIKEIIVGPGPHQEMVYQSVLYFLRHQADPRLAGLSALTDCVKKSCIPLV